MRWIFDLLTVVPNLSGSDSLALYACRLRKRCYAR